MDVTKLTALELGKKIRNKEITAVEATRLQFDRISEVEPSVHSYLTVLEEEAIQQAEQVQRRIEKGEIWSPLAGVPMAIKDNICMQGIRTTCASKMLHNFVPTYDATVVERLKAAGAVVLGKTNMDEFSIGSTSETSYYGSTKNPWNLAHVPGGSSGGSAASVAAGEAFYSLGSDTGGSVRQPSSFCGVAGIKPTYGRVSRYGLVAYASSMDQIGPMARSVADCAAVLEAITGYDPKDSTSVDRKDTRFTEGLMEDVKGMKIGIPRNYMEEGMEEEVRNHIYAAAELFRERGAIVEEFELEGMDCAVPTYYVIASAEASSNLSRYDGVRYGHRAENVQDLSDLYRKSRSEGFGEEVKRRILMGAYFLSSEHYDVYYLNALKARRMIKDGFQKAFQQYDLILGPTAPTTAMKIGESLVDPLHMYLGDVYTVAVNLAGLPAISIPCGRDQKGLPVGMQLIGNYYEEKTIFRGAYCFEQSSAMTGKGGEI